MKILKVAIDPDVPEPSKSFFASGINQYITDIEKEIGWLKPILQNIRTLETQIIEKAEQQEGVQEGQDYYSSDYLAQMVRPETKKAIQAAIDNNGQLFDLDVILRKYINELKYILSNM
jgi:hypothetical protein